jgi:hypothetical protein
MRHAIEVERIHEQRTVAHLAPCACPEEAAQLGLQVAAALRGLVLETSEGREVTFRVEHALHRPVPSARISSSSRSASQA